MAKNCVTEQSARRQRWIENGLLELMQEKTYDEISVTELCGHLDLSRRSFYRYFRDMDDVLDSLLNHTFQELVLPSHGPNLSEFRKSYEFWLQHRDLLEALSRSRLVEKLYEYTLRYTDTNAIGKYLSSEDLDADIQQEASLFILSGFISLVIAWHADGFRKTPEQMAQIAQRLLFFPILNQN